MGTTLHLRIAMYPTCLYCHKPFGTNQVIEHADIGTRFAFDSRKGRFWVVCRRCLRWNLSPLEERWEAMEDCERLFERTRLRMSTDHVGLARVPGGVDLIRIGQPQRPEFAAWRYGDTFGRRRRANIAKAGIGVGVVGAVMVGGSVAAGGVGGFGYGMWKLAEFLVQGSPNKIIARIPTPERKVTLRRKHLPDVRLEPLPDHGWALAVPAGRKRTARVEGPEAMKAVGLVMPYVNRFSGKKDDVRRAVDLLQDQPDPIRYLHTAAWTARDPDRRLRKLGSPVQLALEMAVHEETERRAMEGELWFLERQWEEAERIAKIADDLLVPDHVRESLHEAKRRQGPGGTPTDD